MRLNYRATLLLVVAIAGFQLASTASAATTHYLRPDGEGPSSPTKRWQVVGATSAWDALNDPVTEAEVPTGVDYIADTQSGHEIQVTLSTMNITGVSISNAKLWYYAANSQPFEVKSSADSTWQVSNSPGWHSISQSVGSQSALNNLLMQFRTGSSTSISRQVLAAFLKFETNGPKIYWGAWMDGDVYASTIPKLGDAPWDKTTWDLFEAHAGKPVSIVHFGQPAPWQQEFATEPLEKSKNRGALPLMDMGTGCKLGKTCKSDETQAEEEVNRVSLPEIIEGKYDSYYKAWAEGVAAYKYPLFFRWAWEMNGTWFKWGRDAAKTPSAYVTAWRHIHDIAIAAGATNLTWVWCPNVDYSGGAPVGPLYPGDAYVDWTCLDGYNEGGRQFNEVFGSSYASITGTIAPTKPLMVAETGTVNGVGHLSQGEWIREALRSLPTSFPKIKAFVWFNWNIVEKGMEWPWPIESTSAGQSAFASEISSPYFAPNLYGEPAQLQPIKALP